MNKYEMKLQIFLIYFKKDSDAAEAAIRHGGQSLQYASESQRHNEKMVRSVVLSDLSFLTYASERLKNDNKFSVKLLRMNLKAFEYIFDILKSEKELMIKAIFINSCCALQ